MLLTDGDNTQNRWTTSGSSIDARTALACTNVKAANIKIYTVRVIDGDANLLRNCATKPNMYYNVNQASQLNSVFSSIAQNLANLRHREVAPRPAREARSRSPNPLAFGWRRPSAGPITTRAAPQSALRRACPLSTMLWRAP